MTTDIAFLNSTPISGRDIFGIIKKALDILCLKWNEENDVSLDVCIHNKGLRDGTCKFNFEICIEVANIVYPTLNVIFIDIDAITKLLLLCEKSSLKIQSFSKSGDAMQTRVQEFRVASGKARMQELYFEEVDMQGKSTCVFTSATTQENLQSSALMIKEYLQYIHACFASRWRISLSEYDDGVNNYTDFDNYDLETNRMIVCCSRNPCALGTLNWKCSNPIQVGEIANLQCNCKLQLTVAMSCIPCNSNQAHLLLYIFGPFGLSHFNDNQNMLGINQLLAWCDYGIAIGSPVGGKNISGLLQPYVCTELNILHDEVKPYNLIVIITLDATEASFLLKERVQLAQNVQDNVGHILSTNLTKLQKCTLQALDQLVPRTKTLKRRRANEMSVNNSVSSIFDIVTLSTNDVFRETCLSMLNSVTTHGFREDLHYAFSQYTEHKLEHKRCREEQDKALADSQWENAAEGSQLYF